MIREGETIKTKIYPETIIISKEENVDILQNLKKDPELMDLDNFLSHGRNTKKGLNDGIK